MFFRRLIGVLDIMMMVKVVTIVWWIRVVFFSWRDCIEMFLKLVLKLAKILFNYPDISWSSS